MMNKKFLIFTILSIVVLLPQAIEAQDVLGQEAVFNIESSYDLSGREEVSATLIQLSPKIYWYTDSQWWRDLGSAKQEEIKQSLNYLSLEFEDKIYPTLTKTFGLEWTPGIDKDTRITVLLHPMKNEGGGYINSADEYPKAQIPKSNEREMIYLNTSHIDKELARSFLAHEFTHLITFNQKNRNYGVLEEVWLDEARAEYAPTLLGYDDNYNGSYLQQRVNDFLSQPSDSLTEVKETIYDYGVINLFTHYMVDHYGTNILTDSLRMKKTGIESINAVLAQRGFQTDFSQIFADWTIAVLINDCDISEKDCYFNKNLENLRIVPLLNYLPQVGDSKLSVTNTVKDWAGNWHKFIGGRGVLELEFQAANKLNFKIPYVIKYAEGNYKFGNLILNQNGEGKISIPDFGIKAISLTIIPIAQNKISNFLSIEPFRTFSWLVSTKGEKEINIPSLPVLQKPISEMSRAEILERIAQIRSLIIQLQEIMVELGGGEISCQEITQDLYFGMQNSPQVRCLQEFLKVAPATGNFYSLTQQAVIGFQERYGIRGTGYVGVITRAKINELLSP